jgi:hypothetical protein
MTDELKKQVDELKKQVEEYKHLFKVQAVVKGSLPSWQQHMLGEAFGAVYYKQAASTYHADVDPEIKAVLAPHLSVWKQLAWMVQYTAYKVASAVEKPLWKLNHSKLKTPKAYAVAAKAKKVTCALLNSLGFTLKWK